MRTDNDKKELARNAAQFAFELFRRAGQQSPGHGAHQPPRRRGPNPVLTLALAAIALAIGLAVFLGIIALALKLFEYGVAPIVDYALGRLFPLLLIPGALPVLACAVFVIGLAFVRKFRDPGQFLMGLFVVVLGILCFWQLPAVLGALRPDARDELEGPLLIVGLIVSLFLLVCGVQLMAMGEWVGNRRNVDDDEEFLQE